LSISADSLSFSIKTKLAFFQAAIKVSGDAIRGAWGDQFYSHFATYSAADLCERLTTQKISKFGLPIPKRI
jgi:hypothetical protein